MKLFISHSSLDSKLAEAIIDLIRSALNISASEIRCTSVDGYGLPGGADTEEVLRQEVHSSEAFVGIISKESLDSMYVVFELGARWGANKHLIPLLAPEVSADILSGPLSGINALNCRKSDLHQLVTDLGNKLEIEPDSPASYQKHVDSILKLISTRNKSDNNRNGHKPNGDRQLNDSIESDNDNEIENYCKKQWPDDYKMRIHCIKEQKKALEELNNFNFQNIPKEVSNDIKRKAKRTWPKDLKMQLHQIKEQVQSYRELNK